MISIRNLVHELKFWVIFTKFAGRDAQYEIEQIISVKTIENFCEYFRTLPKISSIPYDKDNKVTVALFVKGIKPAWEDENNKNGSTITFLVTTQKLTVIDEIWKNLLVDTVRGELDCVLENIDHSKYLESSTELDVVVTGVQVVLRGENLYKFDIWTKKYYDAIESNQQFLACLERCTECMKQVDPEFKVKLKISKHFP